jgi:ATP-dependent Zn protease
MRHGDIKRTTYHEVGHAIACDELDIEFDRVSIIPGEGRLGSVAVEGDDYFSINPSVSAAENDAAFQKWAEQQAIVDYAGHAAVVALLGEGSMSDKSARENGASDDFEKARQRLGGDRNRIQEAKARALEIVTKRREDVAKMSEELTKRQRLDGQQFDFVLNDSPILDRT